MHRSMQKAGKSSPLCYLLPPMPAWISFQKVRGSSDPTSLCKTLYIIPQDHGPAERLCLWTLKFTNIQRVN